jgi:Spy/CpxP family protein refolding chaperone
MKTIPYLVLFVLLATSCASQKNDEREIEEKAAHSQISDPKALGGSIHDMIQSSKTLTDAQKQQLFKIVEDNKQKAQELNEQSMKFRAVMVEELFSDNVNQSRIKIIKNDIKKVEELRLKNTFDTVEKITAIISSHPENEKFSDHLINIERSFR